MARASPRKVARYGDRFKATAVKLSSLPGVLIKDVAEALDVHPFMLSLWRKQAGRFPESKELKQLIRDRVAPAKALGHSERNAEP